MKRSRFSEEQIVYAIRQAERGTPVGDLCRQLGVSDATFYAWKKPYAHLGVSELRRLRQVEEDNSRLKRLVPDLSLDKRDECLNVHQFSSLTEAQHIIEAWRLDDNQQRPHSLLGHLTPNEFLEQRQTLQTVEEAGCSS